MLLRAERRQPQRAQRIAGGRFEIEKKLGAGCFGEVWRGHDASTKEPVAVKFEDVRSHPQQLEHEAAILEQITKSELPQGFVRCFHFGNEGRYNFMVLELLGRSLEDHLHACKDRKFSAPTAVLVAEQLLCRIEYLHSKGIVHRDIKPENFMFGVGPKAHHLYMIDFGLAKKYFVSDRHIRYRTDRCFTGTARYASINAHKGVEQSRRDDLEAIGHMLVYFLRGSLPWSGLSGKTEEKYRKICITKQKMPLDELCLGFPNAFKLYLGQVRKLGFRERPDYASLRQLFVDQRHKYKRLPDHGFEWLEGKQLTALVPLAPQGSLQQPDDAPRASERRDSKVAGSSAPAGKPRRSWMEFLLFCGGPKKTVSNAADGCE